MRRPTLYKHRGTWYARIWDTAEGKYHARALGITVEGKRERRREAEDAARILAEKLAAAGAEAARRHPLADTPLLSYIENFWRPDSDYAKEKALVEQNAMAAHYILSNRRLVINKMYPFPAFQGIALAGLSKPLLRQWKLWMAEQGTSGRMINGAMQALRVPVRRAFADDIIPTDPFAGVKRAAHKEKKRGILTPAEIKRLVASPVLDPYTRLAVYLSLYCSMRMGEVRGLLWGDISDGVIHIRHNWQEKEGIKRCKMGSEGYVPMPRVAAELVNRVHGLAPLTGPKDFVMGRKPYHPVSREFLWEALRSELAVIGITEEERVRRNIVFHSLRHSFVTAMRIAGFSDFEIMTMARHKDRKMLERYSHGQEALDFGELRERMDKRLPSPGGDSAAVKAGLENSPLALSVSRRDRR
ncbi:MAG: tyrosine-type recombinase/integrase [Treponema sp.]|jgi:integrase|nr:tyrosine-type recombinase/integrase [Treponema sp.]